MKLSRAAIAFYVGLVFASGVVLGAFGHRLYTVSTVSAKTVRNPDQFRKDYVSEMKARLQLSDAQTQKLNIILDNTNAKYQAEFKAERQKRVPVLQQIHQAQIDEIDSVLTPAQQAEYEKMRKERLEKQKQDRVNKRSGGGGPGPGF